MEFKIAIATLIVVAFVIGIAVLVKYLIDR